MAKTPYLTPQQRESLLTAAACRDVPIPFSEIPDKHLVRLCELRLARWLNSRGFVLTERGKLLAANIAKAGRGQPLKGARPRTTRLDTRVDEQERRAVEDYAARKGVPVSEVVREGLRALGVLS